MIEPKITPYAYKCVLIVDNTLPTGIIANISAVLSMALGKTNPEIIGKDVKDASGIIHAGITQLPIPILGASKTELRHIRERIKDMNEIENSIVDFTTLAQSCLTYEEYEKRIAETSEDELEYIGIGIIANKKTINKCTGNLKLIR
ncbi:MAG: DUF2000 domain-containing protein [Muribaculaceae bacterium]|uniref:DUF2000 domain-containing protein n=1 Tax=uncultured Bacteroides sp. TaxID=162156 RepID=UPI0032207C6D